MKNVSAIIGILLVFLFGAASGSFVTHMVYRAQMESVIGGRPGAREEILVQRLTKKLDLNGAQREQVRSIVHEIHAGIRQVRRQSRPQVEALIEQGQARINLVLTPDQREKFQKIIAERKAHRRPEGEVPPPGDQERH